MDIQNSLDDGGGVGLCENIFDEVYDKGVCYFSTEVQCMDHIKLLEEHSSGNFSIFNFSADVISQLWRHFMPSSKFKSLKYLNACIFRTLRPLKWKAKKAQELRDIAMRRSKLISQDKTEKLEKMIKNHGKEDTSFKKILDSILDRFPPFLEDKGNQTYHQQRIQNIRKHAHMMWIMDFGAEL